MHHCSTMKCRLPTERINAARSHFDRFNHWSKMQCRISYEIVYLFVVNLRRKNTAQQFSLGLLPKDQYCSLPWWRVNHCSTMECRFPTERIDAVRWSQARQTHNRVRGKHGVFMASHASRGRRHLYQEAFRYPLKVCTVQHHDSWVCDRGYYRDWRLWRPICCHSPVYPKEFPSGWIRRLFCTLPF